MENPEFTKIQVVQCFSESISPDMENLSMIYVSFLTFSPQMENMFFSETFLCEWKI